MDVLEEIYKIIYSFKIDKKFWSTTSLSGDDYNLRSKAGPYIKKTIEIAKIMNLRTFVEIGSTRFAVTQKCLDYFDNPHPFDSPDCCGDGHACFFWAEQGFETYTIDIDPNCLTQIKWSYGHFNKNIPENLHPFIPMDGVEFLHNFNKKIDILYLDGWDIGTENYAENHLEAFLAAKPKLSKNHLICIDDTDFLGDAGGKDKLLTPFLLENKYIPLFNGRQTLFIKYE
jgi:hypothetical protein